MKVLEKCLCWKSGKIPAFKCAGNDPAIYSGASKKYWKNSYAGSAGKIPRMSEIIIPALKIFRHLKASEIFRHLKVSEIFRHLKASEIFRHLKAYTQINVAFNNYRSIWGDIESPVKWFSEYIKCVIKKIK
jgi:hypothetical protein